MENAAEDQGEDRRRGRQRSDDAGRAPASLQARRVRHPGHPGQLRRRHHVVLRVGAGPPRLLLGRSEVNERLETKMCDAFDAVLADRAQVQGRHAHRRLHRRHQPRGDGDEDARNVRVGTTTGTTRTTATTRTTGIGSWKNPVTHSRRSLYSRRSLVNSRRCRRCRRSRRSRRSSYSPFAADRNIMAAAMVTTTTTSQRMVVTSMLFTISAAIRTAGMPPMARPRDGLRA